MNRRAAAAGIHGMSDLQKQIDLLPDDVPEKWALVRIVRQLDRTQALVWGILGAAIGAYLIAPLLAHSLFEVPWGVPTSTGLRVAVAVMGFFSAYGLKARS